MGNDGAGDDAPMPRHLDAIAAAVEAACAARGRDHQRQMVHHDAGMDGDAGGAPGGAAGP